MRGMTRIVALASVLALSMVGCGKKKEEAATPPPSPGSAGSAAAAPTPPAPTPTPAPPAPTPVAPAPVALTAAEMKPTCDKLLPVDLATKAFGADKVESASPRLAICTARKGEEVVGSLTVACKEGLDVSNFGGERAAMTKARDLEPMVGRSGYRIGEGSFFVLDDDTPCRLQIIISNPTDATWPDAIRAIMAQVSPANLKP